MNHTYRLSLLPRKWRVNKTRRFSAKQQIEINRWHINYTPDIFDLIARMYQ